MKVTTKTFTFFSSYSFDEMYALIFQPNNTKVSEITKCFRRYRCYLVGLEQLSDKTFSFSFSFPNRNILLSFRKEIDLATKELPK